MTKKNELNQHTTSGSIAYDAIISSALEARAQSQTMGTPHVLVCPSFSINDQFLYHDLGIISGLVAAGARVTYASGYTMCTSPMPIYGGRWHAEEDQPQKDLEVLSAAEQRWCGRISALVDQTISMEQVLDPEAASALQEHVNHATPEELLTCTFHGVQIGHAAMNVVRNMHLVSDITLVPNFAAELREAVGDCLLYLHYFEALLDQLKPDRIFSHDSFYYPWSIMQAIALQRGIPFYSYYQGLRPNCFIYARNRAAMSLDTSRIWQTYKDTPLTAEQNAIISQIMQERRRGFANFHTLPRADDIELQARIKNFCLAKPTAYFPSNVVWDLAALDKDVVFKGFRDTISSLVKWFSEHPQYQLILKAHPDEEREGIPTTVERLRSVIGDIGALPPNVLYVDSLSPVSAFDLYESCRVVICHTSSAGMEAPIAETPVILIGAPHYRGKGFTDDPESVRDFFATLEQRLNGQGAPITERGPQALKYFYHYLYSLSHDVGCSVWPTPPNYDHASVDDFLRNRNFAEVIAAVIAGDEPFTAVTEGRSPNAARPVAQHLRSRPVNDQSSPQGPVCRPL